MNVLEEAEKLLATMTREEKAQLLQWVARDLGDAFPGIESTPGVCAEILVSSVLEFPFGS